MATKLNLAEVTKELNASAGKILDESSRVRKNLDMVLQSLQKKRSAFIRQENEALEKKKLEEQQAMMSQHARAWVMPDDDVELPAETEAPAAPVVVRTSAAVMPAQAETPVSAPEAKAEQPAVPATPAKS